MEGFFLSIYEISCDALLTDGFIILTFEFIFTLCFLFPFCAKLLTATEFRGRDVHVSDVVLKQRAGNETVGEQYRRNCD